MKRETYLVPPMVLSSVNVGLYLMNIKAPFSIQRASSRV